MNLLIRISSSLLVTVIFYFFIYWTGGVLFREFLASWGSAAISGIGAVAAGYFLWSRTRAPDGLMTSMMMGAIIVGAVGFGGGFFGPILFAPEANQGPLLGILITGPLGFVIGLVGGAIYWIVKRKNHAADLPTSPESRVSQSREPK